MHAVFTALRLMTHINIGAAIALLVWIAAEVVLSARLEPGTRVQSSSRAGLLPEAPR